MDEQEFYDYIQEHYTLDGTASRLINNILLYIKGENFVDAEDAQTHLKSLLDGAFGIEEREIKLYRAPECEGCGEYAPYGLHDCDGKMLCSDCEAHWDISDEEDVEKITVLMETNTWANRCGYFFNAYLTPKNPDDESFYPGRDPSPNNGYNCRHPLCESVEDGVGCCYGWACPLAIEADEEDCEAFGAEYEEGEFVVVEIKPEDYCESRMWKRKDDNDAS